MKKSNISVLPLTFEEALVPSRFAKDLRRSTEILAVQELQRSMGISLQGAKFLLERRGMRVVFDNGAQGVGLMRDKTGRELATLVDASGRATANARRVGKAARIASGTATAALAVVEISHVISGHDNAKRLKKVEVRVDRLVVAHKAELTAKLQAIYSHAKEMLSNGFHELTGQDRQELRRYCRDLFEIRARWADDFKFQLRQIKPANAGLIRNIVRIGKEKAKVRARHKRAAEANLELEILQLMNFSIILQMVLSAASGRIVEFRNVTLPDEVERWLRLLEFAEDRVNEIAGDDATEFDPFIKAIADTVAVWIETVPKMGGSKRLQHRAFRSVL